MPASSSPSSRALASSNRRRAAAVSSERYSAQPSRPVAAVWTGRSPLAVESASASRAQWPKRSKSPAKNASDPSSSFSAVASRDEVSGSSSIAPTSRVRACSWSPRTCASFEQAAISWPRIACWSGGHQLQHLLEHRARLGEAADGAERARHRHQVLDPRCPALRPRAAAARRRTSARRRPAPVGPRSPRPRPGPRSRRRRPAGPSTRRDAPGSTPRRRGARAPRRPARGPRAASRRARTRRRRRARSGGGSGICRGASVGRIRSRASSSSRQARAASSSRPAISAATSRSKRSPATEAPRRSSWAALPSCSVSRRRAVAIASGTSTPSTACGAPASGVPARPSRSR